MPVYLRQPAAVLRQRLWFLGHFNFQTHTTPGTLAGSTVLLLSLGWGASVILGRCDLSESSGRAIDKKLTRGFDLDRTGVTTEVSAGSSLCRIGI